MALSSCSRSPGTVLRISTRASISECVSDAPASSHAPVLGVPSDRFRSTSPDCSRPWAALRLSGQSSHTPVNRLTSNTLKSTASGSIERSAEPTTLAPSAGQSAPDERRSLPALSGRQRQAIQRMAEGKSSKEIASHLNLSVKTVDTHRTNVMQKFSALVPHRQQSPNGA
jgi:DNA-binding CsgD family transcriptional regulator